MTVHKIKGKGNCNFFPMGYGCALLLCTRIRLFQLRHLRLSMPVVLDGHNALSLPHFRLTLPLCALMNVAFIQHFCWHFPTAEMVLSCFLIVGMGLCLSCSLLATKNFSKFQPPDPLLSELKTPSRIDGQGAPASRSAPHLTAMWLRFFFFVCGQMFLRGVAIQQHAN